MTPVSIYSQLLRCVCFREASLNVVMPGPGPSLIVLSARQERALNSHGHCCNGGHHKFCNGGHHKFIVVRGCESQTRRVSPRSGTRREKEQPHVLLFSSPLLLALREEQKFILGLSHRNH
ncbi:unnamed protein product, partial [Ectocarpus fasciculatus]